MSDLLSIREASEWATSFLNKKVTPSNINYLIQYGRIPKVGQNGSSLVRKQDLLEYYKSFKEIRPEEWKEHLGEDLNWDLSFEQYKERETTKHVHRLHPYKGKFIPQLVEYFLDSHTDKFKKEIYFQSGDVILDPFCGSGTTLVQACELGIHGIGVDISEFNTMIGNCKVTKYNLNEVKKEIDSITDSLKKFISKTNILEFEEKLSQELSKFNNKYFPSPDYKYKLKAKEINEKTYSLEKEKEFLITYNKLIKEYSIQLTQEKNFSFLDKWFLQQIRKEIEFIYQKISKIQNQKVKNLLSLILSRTTRSCRATTHADLATLKNPVITTYYCSKHGKICKPLFSILKWWNTYTQDTLKRLKEFENLRTDTWQYCLTGDSRNINLIQELEKVNPEFSRLVKSQKIRGVFSSPPYVGLIDYHEQHAYAYDLFGFVRRDNLEIGPLFKGQGKKAQQSYVEGISSVLNNVKKFLIKDYDIFLVANDKYNLYPTIAENSGMRIVNQFKRPVLNRTEKDKGIYGEIIFHFKQK